MKRKGLIICVLVLIFNLMCFESVAFLSSEVKISTWARNEIADAKAYKLMVSGLGDDLTKDITREKFCELVINMIEVSSSKELPVVENPFIDTNNEAIIKAYAAGLVTGTSKNVFSPNLSISREEIAVIVSGAYRINESTLGKSIEVVEGQEYYGFSDEDQMASWAINDIKLVNAFGIIKGDTEGCFFPKGNTKIEEAVIITKRLYEKQILNILSLPLNSERDKDYVFNKSEEFKLLKQYIWQSNDEYGYVLEVDNESVKLYLPYSGSYYYKYYDNVVVKDIENGKQFTFSVYRTESGVDSTDEDAFKKYKTSIFFMGDYVLTEDQDGNKYRWSLSR